MEITIGNIANELLKYSNLIQINTIKDLPYLRAYLSGTNGKSTKCFIYVIQELNGKFSVCDYPNDSNGERIIVTGNFNKPFEMEKNINKNLSDKSLHVKKHLSMEEFISYLHEVLSNYGIREYDPDELGTKTLSQIISGKQRLKRIVDRNMRNFNIQGTISEIIDLVSVKKIPVPLLQIKDYEIKYMKNRFKRLGLDITIENEHITQIDFIAK